MEPIKDTIRNVIQELSVKKPRKAEDDPANWLKKILTKRELEHIKVKQFKHGVLSLSIDSSAWLYNFNLKKEGLMARIQTDHAEIKDIKFRIGDIKWDRNK